MQRTQVFWLGILRAYLGLAGLPMHFYLLPTGKGNRVKFAYPGLDYRGKGGYVCAPPSTLGDRRRSWSWLTMPSPAIRLGEKANPNLGER